MLESTDEVRPLRDRVLVKELPWPGRTGRGLFLPDQAKRHDEVWRAVVLSVGPSKLAEALLGRAMKLLRPVGSDDVLPELVRDDAWHEDYNELREDVALGIGADVKPGDVVLVSKYVHSKVRIGGEECALIGASDILGVVTDGADMLREALLEALARLPAVAA